MVRLKGFPKLNTLSLLVLCNNNYFAADKEGEKYNINLKIIIKNINVDNFVMYSTFNFLCKLNNKNIDSCWKDKFNECVNNFIKAKNIKNSITDSNDHVFFIRKDNLQYFKNNKSESFIIKPEYYKEFTEENNINIENDEYNINIEDFELKFYDNYNKEEIKDEKNFLPLIKECFNENKTDINTFFQKIYEEKGIFKQFINNIKIDLQKINDGKNLKMVINIILHFPDKGNILVDSKCDNKYIIDNLVKKFYSGIEEYTTFSNNFNYFMNYNVENDIYKVNFNNFKLNIEINNPTETIIKIIDDKYECNELKKIYEENKKEELPIFFYLKYDYDCKDKNFTDSVLNNSLKIMKDKKYLVLKDLTKCENLTDDLKKISFKCCYNNKEEKEKFITDFDNFFKKPLSKYNIKYDLIKNVLNCDFLNDLYLYLTDKRKYCKEILKFSDLCSNFLIDFTDIVFQTFNISNGFLLPIEYIDEYGCYKNIKLIDEKKYYENLIEFIETNFKDLNDKIINDFLKNIENKDDKDIIESLKCITKTPINLVESFKLDKNINNSELVKMVKFIFSNNIENYFNFNETTDFNTKLKKIDMYIDPYYISQGLLKYMIEKFKNDEIDRIKNYDFKNILNYIKTNFENFKIYLMRSINNYKSLILNENNFSDIFKSKVNKLNNNINFNSNEIVEFLPDYFANNDSNIECTLLDHFTNLLKNRYEELITGIFNEFINREKEEIKKIDDINKYKIKNEENLKNEFVNYLNSKYITDGKNCKLEDLPAINFNNNLNEIINCLGNRQKELDVLLKTKLSEDSKKFIDSINNKIKDIKTLLDTEISNINTKEECNNFKYRECEEINNYIETELNKIDKYSDNYKKYITDNDNSTLIINNIDNNKKLCCDEIINKYSSKANNIFVVNITYNINEKDKFKNEIIKICDDFILKNGIFDSRKTFKELYNFIITKLTCVNNIFNGDKSIKDSNDVINADNLTLTLEIKNDHLKEEFKPKPKDIEKHEEIEKDKKKDKSIKKDEEIEKDTEKNTDKEGEPLLKDHKNEDHKNEEIDQLKAISSAKKACGCNSGSNKK